MKLFSAVETSLAHNLLKVYTMSDTRKQVCQGQRGCSDLISLHEREILFNGEHFPLTVLYMEGSMLITKFMLGGSGISRLETHGISTYTTSYIYMSKLYTP